jgi:steroid delta-isomerase
MPSHADMVATVEAYVRGFATNDADLICGLFAADATLEDPVGSPPCIGGEAIRQFYTRIMKEGGARLELNGPVRTTARSAAFAFSSYLTRDGVDIRIDPIDVFEFDEAGKIKSMRAYWGAMNQVTS